MISAIIGGYEVALESFSMSFKAGKVPSFKLTVPAYPFPNPQLLVYDDVIIMEDGQVLTTGLIAHMPQASRSDGQTLLNLKCENPLGYLYLEMAAKVQFQNVPLSTAISTVIATAMDSNFAVDDTTTLNNHNITVDVRDKENIWGQLKMILDNARQATYIRYGGFAAEAHQLDVGSFGTQLRTIRVHSDNLVDEPKFKQSTRDPIKEIRPISGKVGSAPANLSDALLIEPSLATDPDYPLSSARQSILNNTILRGKRLRKPYTAIKTENKTAPSQAEKNEAALSLYYRAVREMKASAVYDTLRLTCALDMMPTLYDQIYVDVEAREYIYNSITEKMDAYNTIPVIGWFKIVGITRQYKSKLVAWETLPQRSKSMGIYVLELSNGLDEDDYDVNNMILNRVARNDLEDSSDSVVGIVEQVDVIVQYSTVGANCDYNGTDTGRLFEFALPAPLPVGATSVSSEVKSAIPNTVDWIPVQAVDFDANLPLQLCVSGAGGANWTSADDVTITVTYTFT